MFFVIYTIKSNVYIVERSCVDKYLLFRCISNDWSVSVINGVAFFSSISFDCLLTTIANCNHNGSLLMSTKV